MQIAQDYDMDIQFSKDGQPVTSVYANELFDVTFTSPVELDTIFVNNENMYTVETYNMNHEVVNGQHVYTFQIKLGSAGADRTLNVYGGIFDETEPVSGQRTLGGKVMSIDVVAPPQDPDDYDVTFSIDGQEVTSAAVNQMFDATIVTPEYVTRVSIRNERGNAITLYDLESTVVDGKRIFTCSLSVGSTGQRTFSLSARIDDVNWVDNIISIPFTITP